MFPRKLLLTVSRTTLRSMSSYSLNGREFSVPVPWGVIAGREWGDPKGHPWITNHGWLDNCGSFDLLAPLFPKGHRIIAMDYPGNGLSSHIPKGSAYYNMMEGVLHVRRVSKFFNLPKFGVMGHSMGGGVSLLFAATHPEMVTGFIAIDILKPWNRPASSVAEQTRAAVDQYLSIEQKVCSNKEPSYTRAGAKERLLEGMVFHGEKNSLTPEALDALYERSVRPAPTDADRVVYSRDLHHRASRLIGFHPEHLDAFVTAVKCPTLNVKASRPAVYANPEEDEQAIKLFQTNPLFEWAEAEGNHHVHLNNPKGVMEIINPFLEKYQHVWSDQS